jgi:hypothetical protein
MIVKMIFLQLKTGHSNVVSLSALQIDADDNMRDLSLEDRNCRFPDENKDLKIHKIYSFTSCVFECQLLYAQVLYFVFFV